MNGGGGDDTIVLGSQAADGTDDIIGGSGVDTIQIGAGASFVFSTADSKLQGVENVQLGAGASVTLTGQTEGFNVIGGGGAETIITSAGDDTVNAGLGDDFIQAAAGADVINGGAGSDTVSYADVTGVTSHGQAAVTGMAVNFTGESISEIGAAGITAQINGLTTVNNIVTGNFDPNQALAAGTVQYLTGTKGTTADVYAIDTITSIEGFVGSALNDYIVLGADAVTVDAGAGRDIIFSGTAADNINAGSGDDFVMIASSADHSADETIDGGAGTDVIAFTSVLEETLVLSANVIGVETVQITNTVGDATGGTAENIDASAVTAGLTILGNDGDNRITGSAFADTLDGNDGNDTYIVSTGDTVTEADGEGTDVIVVNADVSFTAAALEGVETATLASGTSLTVDHTDVLGTDNLTTVTGVAGGDAETLIVTGAALGVTATKDFATANITLTNVSLDYRGGVGVDNVTGTSAADLISGGFGDDILSGGVAGADTLSGGDGSDTFDVSVNDSETTITEITDFETGIDTLRVIDTTTTAAGRANLFSALTLSSGDTVESVQVDANGVVSLFDENVALAGTQPLFAITAADVVNTTEALLLNIGVSGTYVFGLDADANGTAESSIVVSTNQAGGVTNIVQLTNVAPTDLTGDIAAGSIVFGTAADDTVTYAAATAAVTYFGLTGNDDITGSGFADDLNGGIGNDTLDGGAGADTLDGGAGADDITGGAGADTIDVGAAGDADIIRYTADTDAGTAGTLATTEGDSITNFVTTEDTINFTGDFATANMTGTTADGADAQGYGVGFDLDDTNAGGVVNTVQVIAAGAATATAADLLDIADLNTAAGALSNGAANDEFIFIFNAGDGSAAIYKFTEDGNNAAIDATELQLLGISDAAIAAGDIAFV